MQLVILTMDGSNLRGYSHMVSLPRALFALMGAVLADIPLASEESVGRNLVLYF